MNCEKYADLIEELIGGELETARAGAVDSHLRACPACAAFYKTARREKEVYAAYLADAEPPRDLWARFQAKLEAEAPAVLPVPEPVAAAGWKTVMVGFFRPLPAFGLAAALVAGGLGLSSFMRRETGADSGNAARSELKNAPAAPELKDREPPKSTADAKVDDPLRDSPKIVKTADKSDSVARRQAGRADKKTAAVKPPKIREKTVVAEKKKPAEAQPNEKQLALRALEKSATAQIEKTELLLRSFRNARLAEGDSVYDVGYEKEQARRLLEKNVGLRRTAETVGDLSTQEILERIEPLLLDIANLENNPLAEKVRDIQMRVKSQNIIASLQTY